MLLAQIARVFAVLSLVSIGGANAVLPEIRRQVVEVHGWMTDAGFANVFAIAHAAPGPNIIMVSLIGWQIAGLPGLLVATVAIMAPSCCLAFVVARCVARWGDRAWLGLLKEALVPTMAG
jgi:chromate transporter